MNRQETITAIIEDIMKPEAKIKQLMKSPAYAGIVDNDYLSPEDVSSFIHDIFNALMSNDALKAAMREKVEERLTVFSDEALEFFLQTITNPHFMDLQTLLNSPEDDNNLIQALPEEDQQDISDKMSGVIEKLSAVIEKSMS